MNFKKEREEIDKIDNELLQLLHKRIEIVKVIGSSKKTVGLPVHDPVREQAMYEALAQKAQAQGVDIETVKAVWQTIIDHSKQTQSNL
jgi:chorismate mutase-like protein